MANRAIIPAVLALTLLGFSSPAEELEPCVQAKVDAFIVIAREWATNAVIVKAVAAHNLSLPAEQADLTQDKWKALSVLDPLVRSFIRNSAAEFLKAQSTSMVTEAFLSDAEGRKVAFLTKPTFWSHKGKPKHEVPMSGRTWQGVPEVDESTGTQQIQIAVPVTDGNTPIGSLVVGLNYPKLVKEAKEEPL